MNARSELAEFLRARREQLAPADVGLPDSGRRRTPGLRREEVATLAGVSIDYLVRLEQGRDTHPSPGVLAALAGALRLSEDERMHLGKLAVRDHSPELCPANAAVAEIAPTVTALLERLDPTPAFVVSPIDDVLARNDAWSRLVRPLGMLDGVPPNLARFTFVHPGARRVYPDWSIVADEEVGRLRAASVRWGNDERLSALVAELGEHREFARRWAAHTVTEKRRGVKRLAHPDLGELRLAFEVLVLPDDGDQRLITWLPADEATAAALDFVRAEPARRLRRATS